MTAWQLAMRNFSSSASPRGGSTGEFAGKWTASADSLEAQAARFACCQELALGRLCKEPHFARRDHIREIVESVSSPYVAGSFTADDVHASNCHSLGSQHEQPTSTSTTAQPLAPANERTNDNCIRYRARGALRPATVEPQTPPKLEAPSSKRFSLYRPTLPGACKG